MVSRSYSHPDQNFFKSNDVYSKGAVVLHLLRMRLGDESFFKGTQLYIDRFKFTQAETDDFRICLEAAIGESLERFFDQWCYRPGLPRLDVAVRWDSESSSLIVRAEQTQTIDADNPAYVMDIPLYVTVGEGEGTYYYLRTDARVAEQSFAFDAAPADVVVDPYFASGAPCKVEKTLAMWLRQIERGPTYLAQVQAAEHLGEFEDATAQQSLARIVEREAADDPLRLAAAWSLADIESRRTRQAEASIQNQTVMPTEIP
jgi:aminopeptidase N